MGLFLRDRTCYSRKVSIMKNLINVFRKSRYFSDVGYKEICGYMSLDRVNKSFILLSNFTKLWHVKVVDR